MRDVTVCKLIILVINFYNSPTLTIIFCFYFQFNLIIASTTFVFPFNFTQFQHGLRDNGKENFNIITGMKKMQHYNSDRALYADIKFDLYVQSDCPHQYFKRL
ncbi:hypothetical protein CsSME_00045910 [Camellia sinensis var. sinensis]